MTVVLTGRRREPLETVAAKIADAGGKAQVEPADVAEQSLAMWQGYC